MGKASEYMKIKRRKTKFYDIRRDGVTQSLISIFLDCRQKARLYLNGWESAYSQLPLVYGGTGHDILELGYTSMINRGITPSNKQVMKIAGRLERQWERANPRASKDAIEHKELSLALLEATMPVYFDYYKKKDSKINFLGLEESFKIPIVLPDGRTTFLRGKKDGVFTNKGLWLLEHKFKSQINEGLILNKLGIDFQVLLYLYCMRILYKEQPEGVLYNVIRRPALRQKKTESLRVFANRVKEDVLSREDFYFYRFEQFVSCRDLDNFEVELFGVITDLYNWLDGTGNHYKNPYNCESKYGTCKFLPACTADNFIQLKKRKTVFQEL